MTPSQERKIMKEVKELLEANDELDKRQEGEIAALKKRVKRLEEYMLAGAKPAKKKE